MRDCAAGREERLTHRLGWWVHYYHGWVDGGAGHILPLLDCKLPTASFSHPLVVFDVQPPPHATSSPSLLQESRCPAPPPLLPTAGGNPHGCSPDHTQALPLASA